MKIPKIIQQKGFALVSAMVVLALVTGVATTMARQQKHSIELVTDVVRTDMIDQHGEGIFLWSKGVLFEDLKDNNTDSENDSWNQPLVNIEIPGGTLNAAIIDEQSKFNINTLGLIDEVGDTARARFRRLLTLLDISIDYTEAISDWIDTDTQTRFPDGAEDDYYLDLQVPYRTANQPVASVSELMLIKDMTLENYQRLLPYITALPADVGINLNTASDQVLLSLSNNMDFVIVESIKSLRAETPINTLPKEVAEPETDSDPSETTDESASNNSNTASRSTSANAGLAGLCESSSFFTESQRRSCEEFRVLQAERRKQSPFTNPTDTVVSLDSVGITEQTNLQSTSLDTASQYFKVIGEVEQYGREYLVSYLVYRDAQTGNLIQLSKSTDGDKADKSLTSSFDQSSETQ